MSHWIRAALYITVFLWNAAQSVGTNCVCTVWGSRSADELPRGTATPPPRVQCEHGSVTLIECPATGSPRVKYCTVGTVNLSLQKTLAVDYPICPGSAHSTVWWSENILLHSDEPVCPFVCVCDGSLSLFYNSEMRAI